MATKTLNTRILLRYDSYENWLTSTLVLKQGEMAICSVPSGKTVDGVTTPPAVLAKIGDNVHTFKDLPWLQAVASDVYAWSKQPTKPTYTYEEIEGLDDHISTVAVDTDTQYNIVKGDDDYTYKLMSKAKGAENFTTEVATLSIPNPTSDINALKALVGDVAVATQISNAIAALKLSETYEQKGAADAVKTALLGNADEPFNTLGKLEEAVIAAQLSANAKTTMAEVEAKDYATKTEAQGYASAVVGKDTDASTADTVKGAKAYAKDLNDASEEKIKALQEAVGVGGSVETQISDAIATLDVAEVAVGTGEILSAISETDGKISVSKRALVAGDIPTIEQSQVNGLAGALAAKQDVLAFEGEYNKESNKAVTKNYLDAMIADLNGAMHFRGVVTGETFEAAIAGKTYAAGDVVAYGVDEYLYDGTAWHALGNESIYQLKSDAAAQHIALKEELNKEIAKKQDILTFDGIYSESNAAATKSTVTNAIANLKKTDAAVEKQFVSAVEEQAGIITVHRRALTAADIPAISQSQVENLDASLAGKQDMVSFDGVYGADNKAATVSTVTEAIASLKSELKSTDAAVEHQFVTAVSEENGIVAVTRKNITTDDIIQGSDTLILFGGTSVLVV